MSKKEIFLLLKLSCNSTNVINTVVNRIVYIYDDFMVTATKHQIFFITTNQSLKMVNTIIEIKKENYVEIVNTLNKYKDKE